MDADRLLRRALWTTTVFNLAGALAFAFPASFFGVLAGLPPETPLVYRVVTALFVFSFGGAYAWLAMQPVIDRPLVGFAAVGKTSVFAASVALFLVGELPPRSVLLFAGDLGFAALFAWWLRTTGRPNA